MLDEIQVKNNQIKKKNPFKSVQSVFHFWNLTALPLGVGGCGKKST
jgi:hypothetical protein